MNQQKNTPLSTETLSSQAVPKDGEPLVTAFHTDTEENEDSQVCDSDEEKQPQKVSADHIEELRKASEDEEKEESDSKLTYDGYDAEKYLSQAITFFIREEVALYKNRQEPLSKYFFDGKYHGFQLANLELAKNIDTEESSPCCHVRFERKENSAVIEDTLKLAEVDKLLEIYHETLKNRVTGAIKYFIEHKTSLPGNVPLSDQFPHGNYKGFRCNKVRFQDQDFIIDFEKEAAEKETHEKFNPDSDDEPKAGRYLHYTLIAKEAEELIAICNRVKSNAVDAGTRRKTKLANEPDSNLTNNQQRRFVNLNTNRALPPTHRRIQTTSGESKVEKKEDPSVGGWLGFLIVLSTLTAVTSDVVGACILAHCDLVTKGINNFLGISTSPLAADLMTIPTSLFLLVLMCSFVQDKLQSPSQPLGTNVAKLFHSAKDGLYSLAATLGCKINESAGYRKVPS